MKKLFLLFLLTPFLFACSSDNDESNGNEDIPTSIIGVWESESFVLDGKNCHTTINFLSDNNYNIYTYVENSYDIIDFKVGTYRVVGSIVTFRDTQVSYNSEVQLSNGKLTIKNSDDDYIKNIVYNKKGSLPTQISTNILVGTWSDLVKADSTQFIFTSNKQLIRLDGSDIIIGSYECEINNNKITATLNGKSQSFTFRIDDSKLTFVGDYSGDFSSFKNAYIKTNSDEKKNRIYNWCMGV